MSPKFKCVAWVMFDNTIASVPKEGRKTAWDWEPCLFLAASTQPRWTAHSSCPCPVVWRENREAHRGGNKNCAAGTSCQNPEGGMKWQYKGNVTVMALPHIPYFVMFQIRKIFSISAEYLVGLRRKLRWVLLLNSNTHSDWQREQARTRSYSVAHAPKSVWVKSEGLGDWLLRLRIENNGSK